MRLFNCGQNAEKDEESQDDEEFFGFNKDGDEIVPVQEEQAAVVPVTRQSQRANFGVLPARYNTIGLAVHTCAESKSCHEAIASPESEK